MPAVKKGKSKGRLKKTASRTSFTEATKTLLPPAPGGPLEIVFTFDTTGSMAGCLMEVRKKVTDIITRLTSDIPALRIAVFAHGDYCDAHTYVTKYIDFTNDVTKLTDFVNNVESTGGGDWEECYELVLNQARELLSWSPGTQRSLVMIGDAIPHNVSYRDNKKKLDWKKETARLRDDLGVKIYAVQAFENAKADFFWKDLAKMTGGKRLNLGQFDTIVDMMMAICYREQGAEMFDDYEKEVRAREGAALRAELDRMFDTLRTDDTDGAGPSIPPSSPTTTTTRKAPSLFGTPSKTTSDVSMDEEESEDDEGFSEEEDEDESDNTWTPSGERKYRKSKIGVKKTTTFKAKTPKISKAAIKTTIKKSVAKRRRTEPKLLREMVPELGFKLSPMTWSPWKPVMMKEKGRGDAWVSNAGAGYTNKNLFSGLTKSAAVYEVAVQPSYRAKRYPVYYKTSAGLKTGSVDKFLLKGKKVREQAESCVKKGCKIYVRQAKVSGRVKCHGQVLSGLGELKSLMAETYDYPWCRTSRCVEKAGVQISQDLH